MSETRTKFWEVWGQSDALYDTWANHYGLSSSELFILYALDEQNELSQKQIAINTGLAKQTVNNVIKALIQKNYITLMSSSKDKREKYVVLTDEGKAYSKPILEPLYKLEENVFKVMGIERAQQMIDAITIFNLLFEKEMKDQFSHES